MKRKVVMLMLSVAVAVSMVLVGCAPEAAPPAEEEEAPETPSGVSDQAITWKLQTMMPPGTAPYDSLVRLSDAITKASGGRLVFTPSLLAAWWPLTKSSTESTLMPSRQGISISQS